MLFSGKKQNITVTRHRGPANVIACCPGKLISLIFILWLVFSAPGINYNRAFDGWSRAVEDTLITSHLTWLILKGQSCTPGPSTFTPHPPPLQYMLAYWMEGNVDKAATMLLYPDSLWLGKYFLAQNVYSWTAYIHKEYLFLLCSCVIVSIIILKKVHIICLRNNFINNTNMLFMLTGSVYIATDISVCPIHYAWLLF